MTNVLVVDDDLSLLRLIRLTLKIEGLSVETASGGLLALAMLDERTPDVIVLDLNMPGMNGRAFHHSAREAGYQGPVIICSAFDAEAVRKELGAAASLAKPFDPSYLASLIRSLAND